MSFFVLSTSHTCDWKFVNSGIERETPRVPTVFYSRVEAKSSSRKVGRSRDCGPWIESVFLLLLVDTLSLSRDSTVSRGQTKECLVFGRSLNRQEVGLLASLALRSPAGYWPLEEDAVAASLHFCLGGWCEACDDSISDERSLEGKALTRMVAKTTGKNHFVGKCSYRW